MASSDEDDRVAIGDETRVNPFDAIVTDLISDLDGDDLIFKEIVDLSRTPLGFSRNDVKTGADYFKILKNNLSEEDMLDFLINVTDYQNWHRDLGNERVADTLKRYRDKLEQHKAECMRKDIFDPNFVGRDKEINTIINLMKTQRSTVTGVSIWGSGGIGKTTLGNEICRRLWAFKAHWQVIKIDLRGKDSMGDLLKDIILELQLKDDSMNSPEDLYVSLKDTMENKMQDTIIEHLGKISRRTIVMLDNVDDIINKNDKEFLPFVQRLLKKLQTRCKVRVIITSRVNLLCNNNGRTIISNLREILSEVEIRQLERHHAKELIRKCTPKGLVSEEECDSLVTLTESNPLAVRTICSILKNCCRQVKPAEVIAHLRSNASRLSMVGMEKCLQESFDRLKENMKNLLMQLTLFKTSPFDLDAAYAVLREDAQKSPILLTKMNLFHLKSRHLIEIQDMTIQTEGNMVQNSEPRPQDLGDNRSVLYSLHPLVFEFLSKQKSQFSDVMRPARIKFFEYMENIIAIIGKEQENSFYRVESYMREYHVHIQSYFEVVSEIEADIHSSEIEARISNMTTLNRISEIGRRVLTQQGQLQWLHWVSEKAERKEEIDKWFNFRGYIIQLLTEMDKISGIPDIIRKTEEKLDRAQRKSDPIKFALGNYFYRKSMYFKKVDDRQKNFDNLEIARTYLEGVSGRPMTTMVLANVYNEFGCYYYLHDNKKCREYHERAIDTASQHSDVEDHPDVNLFKNNLAVCLLKDIMDTTLDQSSRDQNISEALEHFNSAIRKERMNGTDNTEPHAAALRNRSVLYLQLKKYEEAIADAKKCLEVRSKILSEPHVDLTLSYSNVARILYNWGDQKMRDGDVDTAFNLLKESVSNYDKTMAKMRNGGMSTDHDEYAEIKKFHLKAVDRTDHSRKQVLQQEYREFECVRRVDSSDDGISLNSEEEHSSSDELILSDSQTDSSQDEQTGTSWDTQTATLKEVPVDAQKSFDDTQNFQAPMSKGGGRYEHQESGYISGCSISSFRSSTSRRLSRQESFEDLNRPRLTSNTSGSSEDVFTKRPSSVEISLEELLADISPRKSHSRIKGRRHYQQEVMNKGDNPRERLLRGNSDTATFHATDQGADRSTPVELSKVITEGQNEPVISAKVPRKETVHGDSKDCSIPVKVTGKRRSQDVNKNPVIPAKVRKEERSQLQGDTENPGIPVKVTEEESSQLQGDTENPGIPAKVRKEERGQADTENPGIPATVRKEERSQLQDDTENPGFPAKVRKEERGQLQGDTENPGIPAKVTEDENSQLQGDTENPGIPAKVTEEESSQLQGDTENPGIPAKVRKEERGQGDTENPGIPATVRKEERGQGDTENPGIPAKVTEEARGQDD